MTDAPKGSLGFSGQTEQTGFITSFQTVPMVILPNPLKPTTFKKVVNRSDLQDTLHILMQNANFRLSIRIDDKFWKNSNIESFIKCSICTATVTGQAALGST